ncbi:MAG: hypothetical protein FJ404_11660 [Verrucomicrobia bacterium]|nr:hypothetical protein [Verrucomicrobiota bacterium]
MIPEVTFAGREWLQPVLGLGLVVFLLSLWAHWKSLAAPGKRLVCFFLRMAAYALLAICVLEPQAVRQRAKTGQNYFVVLADNSQGLQIHDRGDARSRGQHVMEFLRGEKRAWRDTLSSSFEVRRYYFDERLQASRDFGELDFQGPSSALHQALKGLAARFKSQPLAGVLLLSDGNATDAALTPEELKSLPPIFPLAVGSGSALRDMSIDRVKTTQSVFEDAPSSVEAEIRVQGFAGEKIKVTLVEIAEPATVARAAPPARPGRSPSTNELARLPTPDQTQTITVPSGQPVVPVTFRFRPVKSGVSFFKLEASAESGGAGSEATLLNNRRTVAIDRGRGMHRILYVSGRPNWEYKFLNRALDDDHELDLVAIIRIARREPKFDFLGRPGETSNPLYRGFGNQDQEETERYDQPVLIRLNTRDKQELKGGFPKTAEELYEYEAVIVDDLESGFFTREQLTLLQKFVSERGGGFLMLGGADSLQDGKYQRTPVSEMLPLYLDRVSRTPLEPGYRWELTREGVLQPWMRTHATENAEQERVAAMPPFQVVNRLEGVKPGASVMAVLKAASGTPLPALVVQRYGHGRTAAMTVGDYWRWGMRHPDAQKEMAKTWRQLARWLVTDSATQVSVELQPQLEDSEPAVKVRAQIKDKAFQPLDNASVLATVQPLPQEGSGTNRVESFRLSLDPSAREPGVYESTFLPRWPGGYRVQVVATNDAGAEIGQAEGGWTSDPAADEFRSLQPNKPLLEALAQATGGAMVEAGDLESWAQSMPNRKAPISEPWIEPLWHRGWVFGLALALWVIEWGLRRRSGMA